MSRSLGVVAAVRDHGDRAALIGYGVGDLLSAHTVLSLVDADWSELADWYAATTCARLREMHVRPAARRTQWDFSGDGRTY